MRPLEMTLLPSSAEVRQGELAIGGCRVVDLAEKYGTPLFIYDEEHIRSRCREAVTAFPDGVSYAAKAFLCSAMARLVTAEGMGIDVASGGELELALRSGVTGERLVFHGNNKSRSELVGAVNAGVGRIVVDSPSEVRRLAEIAAGVSEPIPVMVRVNPGVEAHTHQYLHTGGVDSKFGVGIESGAAQDLVHMVKGVRSLEFVGVHAHVGSQVFAVDSFRYLVRALARFVEWADPQEVSFGGGLGVAYVAGEKGPSISEWGQAVVGESRRAGITARIVAEPGRAIVAQAAITVYTVGTIKRIPGVRTYVAVDGGMSDNPRPVLYGSGYEAFLPRAVDADRDLEVRMVGKHCESGDVLVWNGMVPSDLEEGDLIATPVTGAYGYSMGSNYNLVPRPAVVFVADGHDRLVVRRETHEDMLSRDMELD